MISTGFTGLTVVSRKDAVSMKALKVVSRSLPTVTSDEGGQVTGDAEKNKTPYPKNNKFFRTSHI
jgi:hypothetical protein